VVVVGAAQLGPVSRSDSRAEVVERLLALLHRASKEGCELVVYPELALTTFFPRWFFSSQSEVDSFFETEMPGASTRPLFEEARKLGIGFSLGYAELTPDAHHYNTQILVERDGTVVGKYRKVHLPGHEEHEPSRPFQNLERVYF
jgi:predicted amidohydrolase